MSEIHTEHHRENGEQVTIRRVTYEDATGKEYEHEFEVGDDTDLDAHKYRGDGDPPESAVDKLREFLAEPESTDD